MDHKRSKRPRVDMHTKYGNDQKRFLYRQKQKIMAVEQKKQNGKNKDVKLSENAYGRVGKGINEFYETEPRKHVDQVSGKLDY